MRPLDTDPDSWHAAGDVVGTTIAGAAGRTLEQLAARLGEASAMAGSDPAGRAWAASYDPVAEQAVGAVADVANACLQVAALLQATGFNHAMAEASSDPRRRVPPPARGTDYAAAVGSFVPSVPPTAAGGSGGGPPGWGLIAAAVGHVWPNGHQDRLRSTARAWWTAAEMLSGAGDCVGEAVVAIAAQDCPEADDALAVVTGMGDHLIDVAGCCRELGSACEEYAQHLDQAHHDIEHELISLGEWSVGIGVVGGIVGFLTGGIGAAGAAELEHARIAATAGRVAAVIVRLIGLAESVGARVSALLGTISRIGIRMKAILQARVARVTATVVDRLPAAGKARLARSGLAADTGRLAKAAHAAQTETPAELLLPGGEPIGVTGTTPSIRELHGGLSEARSMFDRLSRHGRTVSANTKLTRVELPGGGFVQLRTAMSKSPGTAATIDVNIPGIAIRKLKFNP